MIVHKDFKVAKFEIAKALLNCADALGINMSDNAISVMSDDIIEKYKCDSIEDCIECLKRGRRGDYGFGHNSRSSINMILFSEWMSKLLEEKASKREIQLSKHKTNTNEELPNIDYEAYKKRKIELDKKLKEDTQNGTGYKKFIAEYYLNKKESEK